MGAFLYLPQASVSITLKNMKTRLTHTSDAFPEKAHEGVVRHKAACKVRTSMGRAWYRRNASHGLDHCRQDAD
jgi:hypothetical protein